MTPERWRELKQQFQALLERDDDGRRELLSRMGSDDPELRRELELLLESHGEVAGFMESPAFAADFPEQPAEPLDFLRGRRVGAYELQRELGRGGMGTVYLAARADAQFRKQVAVKLIKRGMDTEAVLQRFRTERQILAQLEHPHIARLLDGGTTDDGLPYLVMEYIDGEPLFDYASARQLSIRERLKLFCLVCSAVQYAHQNLVIHRDLKPSNIMVTADGTPKLLDFGVAKLLHAEPAEAPIDATSAGLRPMTPEYASPEQVQGELLTTATDVYSLGVILYGLLTGRRPYRLSSNTPEELIRVICEQEPAKPSTAAERDAERHDADLDNIVLKALRKQPSERYPSVEQFSDDVRRYLDGLPILARPSTIGYRAGKFARRHRTAMAAAALIVLSLVGDLLTTAWQAHLARLERARAERSFADVRHLANSLLFEFHDAIAKLPGSTPARVLIIKRAREYLERLAGEPGAEHNLALQAELATAYEQLGQLQGLAGVANVGDSTGALASFQHALAIRTALQAAHPRDPQALDALAHGHNRLSQILALRGQRQEAHRHAEEAVRIAELRLAAQPTANEARIGIIKALDGFTNILVEENDLSRVTEIRRRILKLEEELNAATPDNRRNRRGLALACKRLGAVLEATGDFTHAIELYRRALAIDQALVAADPNDATVRRDLSLSYGSLGFALYHSGDLRQGLDHYQRALELREALSRADPSNAEMRITVAAALGRIGEIHKKAKHWTDALQAYRRSAAIRQQLVAADPKNAREQAGLAGEYQLLGDLHAEWAADPQLSSGERRRRLGEARTWYAESQTLWSELEKQNALTSRDRVRVKSTATSLAKCEAELARQQASTPRRNH